MSTTIWVTRSDAGRIAAWATEELAVAAAERVKDTEDTQIIELPLWDRVPVSATDEPN